MASAAKKRKAARKKKKELESQITSNPHENGDLISENEKDSDGSVQNDSSTSEDHSHLFSENKENLKSGESLSLPCESMNKPLESNATVQIAKDMEARDDSQIEQRDVEEAFGKGNDGQGRELKSNGILIAKVIKGEETGEELESAIISIDRLECARESCNGESESLPMANSAEKPIEEPMILTVEQRTPWMNCCGLLDVITGSKT